MVVNLYPFSQTVARPDCTLEEAIENIDIGGPAMVRAAAKNYRRRGRDRSGGLRRHCCEEMKAARRRGRRRRLRFQLACKAFSHTAAYDGAISNYLTSMDGEAAERSAFPAAPQSAISILRSDLRYGENPHQQAAFYRDPVPAPGSLASYTQLQGKELSYNNIADADAAWECVRRSMLPACVIVKHANPCGVAVGRYTA